MAAATPIRTGEGRCLSALRKCHHGGRHAPVRPCLGTIRRSARQPLPGIDKDGCIYVAPIAHSTNAAANVKVASQRSWQTARILPGGDIPAALRLSMQQLYLCAEWMVALP